jgi:recombination protein RecR
METLSPLDRLLKLVGKLPGIGPRSARRVVLHLLKKRDALLQPLIDALIDVRDHLKTCTTCGNWDMTDPCQLCQNPKRDDSVLCVVADVADLWAMERSLAFQGRYHVLGGTLSALDGVQPEHLRLESLVKRCTTGVVREVVLALNVTIDGQTTAHYIASLLHPTGVKITRLASGVPVGGELDYLDDGTIHTAMQARMAV